ncbi:MAG TPA: hypothetical protein PKO13_01760, partial [Nitrosomonas sp.]|nr:hypothetical protein [Nitrosomonas sp.]HNM71726.1 hypothetical protein [Nitrosomonas sp.]
FYAPHAKIMHPFLRMLQLQYPHKMRLLGWLFAASTDVFGMNLAIARIDFRRVEFESRDFYFWHMCKR